MTVTPDGAGLRWREDGELAWNGWTTPITRTMGFEWLEREWWVVFDDGRPFHPWRLGVLVSHPCGLDVYLGRLHYGADLDRLTVGWDVTGPVKQQRIVTTYRRVS